MRGDMRRRLPTSPDWRGRWAATGGRRVRLLCVQEGGEVPHLHQQQDRDLQLRDQKGRQKARPMGQRGSRGALPRQPGQLLRPAEMEEGQMLGSP